MSKVDEAKTSLILALERLTLPSEERIADAIVYATMALVHLRASPTGRAAADRAMQMAIEVDARLKR